MTDKTALRHLIEAVEAGSVNPRAAHFELGSHKMVEQACDALNGSLDASRALHEALLPGWKVLWDSDCKGHKFIVSEYTCYDSSASTEAEAETPARAWLICILKAYEAQQ